MGTNRKPMELLGFGLGRPRRPAVWIVLGLATVLGLIYGYDFGQQIGGALLGVVAAVNAAVFCAILAGSVMDRVFPDRSESSSQE